MTFTGQWVDAWYITDRYKPNVINGDILRQLIFKDLYVANHWSNSFKGFLTFSDDYHVNTFHNTQTDTLTFSGSFSNIFNTIITANWQLQDQYNAVINYWQDDLAFTDHIGTINDIEINLNFTDQYNSSVAHAGQWIDYMAWNSNSGFNRPYSTFMGYLDYSYV